MNSQLFTLKEARASLEQMNLAGSLTSCNSNLSGAEVIANNGMYLSDKDPITLIKLMV